MIGKREKNRLIKELGKHYSSAVLDELNNDNVLTKHNNPHSADMIRNVMNGVEHAVIEQYIYKAFETSVAKRLQEAAKRKKILKSA